MTQGDEWNKRKCGHCGNIDKGEFMSSGLCLRCEDLVFEAMSERDEMIDEMGEDAYDDYVYKHTL